MQFVEITQVSLRQVHYVNAIIDVVSVMLTMMILHYIVDLGLCPAVWLEAVYISMYPYSINLIACKQVMQCGM